MFGFLGVVEAEHSMIHFVLMGKFAICFQQRIPYVPGGAFDMDNKVSRYRHVFTKLLNTYHGDLMHRRHYDYMCIHVHSRRRFVKGCLDYTVHSPFLESSFFSIVGMVVTRSLTKRSKTSWSDLSHDLLCIIMMQLGVIDFIAFSCVCKSWRSLALSNWYKFMGCRQPMSLYVSTGAKKECFLEDYKGRKFKTVLPHSKGRFCVGLTCGYLILWGIKARDFCLVNPLTRHEFHFPGFPISDAINPAKVRGALVFSPSHSCWMLVISFKSSLRTLYSFAGEGLWHQYDSAFNIHDLFAFKEKIYVISVTSRLCEMKLTPHAEMMPLDMKKYPMWYLLHSVFVTSGENKVYVVGYTPGVKYLILEVDFGNLEWVLLKDTTGEYAFFLSELSSGAAIKPEMWTEPGPVYERGIYFIKSDKSQRGRSVKTWYFPHDCLNLNLPYRRDA